MLTYKNNIAAKSMSDIRPFVLTLLAIYAPVFSDTVKPQNYPLFLRLDGQYEIATSLYLKCDAAAYNGVPISEYKESGQRVSLFKEVLFALKRNNPEDILKLSCTKNLMTDKDREVHLHNVDRIISNFSEVLTDETVGSDCDQMKLFHQFYFGEGSYIVFGAEDMKAGLPYRLMMKFRCDSSGQLCWDVEKPTEFRFVLQTLVNQMAMEPVAFRPTSLDAAFDYVIPLPGAEIGHPAYLQFNGKKYNINVSKDKVDPTDKAATLFQQQFTAVKQSREALAKLYGGRSRDVYLQWIEDARLESLETGANRLDWHFEEMASVDRILRFVLEADPLYVVFYQKEGNSELMNQFILRDPQSGELKFRNLFVSDFFEQWFNSPALQSSLRSLILADPSERQWKCSQ